MYLRLTSLNGPLRAAIALLISLPLTAQGQGDPPGADTGHVHQARLIGTIGGGGLLIGGTLIGLDQAWYGQYQRVAFHGFDDGPEWMGLDKAGHVFATYTVGEWGYGLLRWCGVKERTAIWAGGSLGFVYLAAVEYMDGRSSGWGFSGWDFAANAVGSGLFIAQQSTWHEQRFRVKYSSHLTDFAEQRPGLLGSTLPERILKDYNGCTFWLSANLHSLGWKRMPAWLNLAAGYGADGMLGARDREGVFGQFYLSPDIDLTRIPTRSKFLRTVLFALNCVKVPLPAIEVRGNGEVRGHVLYF